MAASVHSVRFREITGGFQVVVKWLALLVVLCLVCVGTAGCSASETAEVSVDVSSETPAEVPAEVPAEEPAAEPEVQPFEPDVGVTLDTPYYTITLPESWAGTTSFTYIHSYSTPNPGLGIGYSAGVVSNDTRMSVFGVSCFTDAWGPQGAFSATTVGPLPQLEGNHLTVSSPLFDLEQNRLPDMTPEYATYVTIKEDPAPSDKQTLNMPYYFVDLSAPEVDGWLFTYNGSHDIEGTEGIGYSLDVTNKTTGDYLFSVACATEGFGPEAGDGLFLDVGAPAAWPQARVYAFQLPLGLGEKMPVGDLASYARYVSAK